jgi:hypothetical protein
LPAKISSTNLDVLTVVALDFNLEGSPEECRVQSDYSWARTRFNAEIVI